MSTPWNDEDLYNGIVSRQPQALEALVDKYSREMLYFARLILVGIGTVQDAEECVNDLFVAVWNDISSFDPQRATMRTWLSMRTKYLALDRRRVLQRKNRSVPVSQIEEAADQSEAGYVFDHVEHIAGLTAEIDEMINQSEQRQEIWQALSLLSKLDRYLVYARYFKYATADEMSARTGLTKHAIDLRLWRARKSLKTLLSERLDIIEAIND